MAPFWKSLLGSSSGSSSSNNNNSSSNPSNSTSSHLASSTNSSTSSSSKSSRTLTGKRTAGGGGGGGAGDGAVVTTESPASSIASTSSSSKLHGRSSKSSNVPTTSSSSSRKATGTSSNLSSSVTSSSSHHSANSTPTTVSGSRAIAGSSSSSSSGGGSSNPSNNNVRASSATSTSATGPIGIPVAQSTNSTSHNIASSVTPSSAGNTTAGSVGAGGGTTTGDEEEDEIPPTPYSTGHSPSHARHRFPTPSRQQQQQGGGSLGNINQLSSSAQTNDDAEEYLVDDESPSSNPGGGSQLNNGSATGPSNIAQGGSTKNNNAAPASTSSAAGTGAGAGAAAAAPPRRPDIPTTQTILANPLPQPSSGLAAAISSVLPSSSLHGSSGDRGGANGKSGSGGDSGPRTFDIDDMIAKLLEAGYSSKLTKSVCLKNSEITAICLAAREVFLSQPTLIELSPPVKIVGDVHGQYSDVIRLFEMCGFPPKSNYLFLGDYVDRGKQSLETILLLLCYKVKYPENFFLLRGNHECANVTRVYGFYDECKRRCNIKIWKTFIDVFNCLPITALVAGKIFCVHGGLSPSLSTMDDIRRISRPTDVPDYGLLNDLLWSDPSDTALDWEDNERGVSYCFGKSVIQDFLAKYDFDLICRAHMVVEDGYEFWNERTLVTIFSAPNYCGEFDNFGAVMSVSEDLLCAFELLKPLDGPALKKELMKSKRKNSAMLAAAGQ